MSVSYIMRRFDSIHKFVDHLKKNPDKSQASHRKDSGSEWAGTRTFEEAVEFAKNGGWEPNWAPEFRNVFNDLVPMLRKFTDVSMERFANPVGFEVNIPAYCDGEPDHMFEWVPEEAEVQKRALCLLIGHSVSAGCTEQELFTRGQAVVGLVRALKLLGFELEVWSEETVSAGYGGRNGEMYSTLVRLQAAGDITDESAIEFAIGNPAWLRRLLFASQENESDQIRRKYGFGPGGYGSIVAIQHADLVGADLTLDLGRTWFGEGRYGGSPEEQARQGVDWVVAQLKELGALEQDAELDWNLSD